MIKLNRTTEYALMALKHMGRNRASRVSSAREIAELYGLPFDITAKTLQRLKDVGLIRSAQGARGGYLLVRSLESISLGEFLNLMEGSSSIVECMAKHVSVERQTKANQCEYRLRCEIQTFMLRVQEQFFQFFSGISLAGLSDLKFFEKKGFGTENEVSYLS